VTCTLTTRVELRTLLLRLGLRGCPLWVWATSVQGPHRLQAGADRGAEPADVVLGQSLPEHPVEIVSPDSGCRQVQYLCKLGRRNVLERPWAKLTNDDCGLLSKSVCARSKTSFGERIFLKQETCTHRC
jgi:hypothetical protein